MTATKTMKGNIKAVVVCLLAILWLGLLPVKADAISVQLYGGGGAGITGTGDTTANSIGMGLNIFVYEGGNLDIFLGAEQDSFSADAEIFSGGAVIGKIKTSWKATGFGLGFRLKPTTIWRVKPYFPVELKYFQVEPDVKFTIPNYTLISTEKETIGARAGVGTDIGLSDRLTLMVEGYVFIIYPGLREVKFNDGSESVKQRDMVMPYTGINLGLRYSF